MRIRFSLRGLLVLVAILAALCAFIVNWWRSAARQHMAAAFLENVAFVGYGDEYHGGEDPPEIVHEPGNWKNDLFHSVVHISFHTNINDFDLKILENLPGLQLLNLPQNNQSVTDTGMKYVAELRSLKFLTLGSAITDNGLARLNNLRELQSLNLATCSEITGSGLAALNCSRTLNNLSLGQGVQDEYLKYVQRFTRLKRLWIGIGTTSSHVTDRGIENLSGHPSLERLIIIDLAITKDSCKALASLPELEDLWITGTKINDVSCLAGCRKLRRLKFTGNKVIDDQRLQGLESLGQLEELNLSYTSVTGKKLEALERLPRLRVLSLTYCPVDDTAIDEIAKLRSLEWIDLYGTTVTEHGKERLRSLRPDLHIGEPDEINGF
jgi:Leucine-rich repeat (LRR) protein